MDEVWGERVIEDFFQTHGVSPTYWVAFSGGIDSYVLLHMCAAYRLTQTIQLRAIHVNHHLSPHAALWALQCKKICEQLQIDFVLKEIDAKNYTSESPEEYAREKRYAVFKELLSPGDFLLTAHQQDDQAETVLLQLLRGSGPKGLAAMPLIKRLGKGFHARPLLSRSREALKSYATLARLKWIEDESNIDVHFSRNFIRHQVLPILQKRWPAVTTTLSRVAKNCAEATTLMQVLGEQDLQLMRGSLPNALSVTQLLTLDKVRQRHVLRCWLHQLGFPLPSATKIQQIQRDMLYARSDRRPHMAWKNVQLRRYRDDLFALPLFSPHDSQQVFSWDLQQDLPIPGVGSLSVIPALGKGLRMDISRVEVRFRACGETFLLQEAAHRHTLKNFFQENNIPPWQRDRVPLIFVDQELAGVVGYFVCEKFKSSPGMVGQWIANSSCRATEEPL